MPYHACYKHRKLEFQIYKTINLKKNTYMAIQIETIAFMITSALNNDMQDHSELKDGKHGQFCINRKQETIQH